MRKAVCWCAVSAVLAASVTGCSSDGGGAGGSGGGSGGSGGNTGPTSVIDIRADVNRNGVVDLTDATEDELEAEWSAQAGAIFLANIDDEEDVCPSSSDITDTQLATCFDAADDKINGEADLADMARIKTVPWPEAPANVRGRITLSNAAGADPWQFVRVFKNNAGAWEPAPPELWLEQADMVTGVELAIEAKDIVRNRTLWDGYVDVSLEVEGGTAPNGQPYPNGTDAVRLRVAPLLFMHHLQLAEEIYATNVQQSTGSALFRADLAAAAEAAGVPGGLQELSPLLSQDQWTQDWMELAWMTMPKEGGEHRIVIYMRSSNVFKPSDTESPLRKAGRHVYERFHGPDVAGMTPDYDINHDGFMDSLNSFGNLETIPPYELNGQKYTMGRVFRGKVDDFFPDPAFVSMSEAQEVQPPVYVDTSWLLVGHVDETISFVKMNTARGWGMAVNDVALAKSMLEGLVSQGHGDAIMFTGKKVYNDANLEVLAEASVSQVLADTEVMSESAKALVEVDEQLAILKTETGITDAEILHIPFLHEPAYGYSLAYQPGTVNGIYLSDTIFGAPTPHGPVISGVDPFQKQLTDEFAKHGISVQFIEDWDLYHRLSGEVHCGSNTKRALPTNGRWWESGR